MYVVKRINKHFNKRLNLEDNTDHNQKIKNHINILKEVDINYWETREKIVKLAEKTLLHGGFKKIINTLEEYDEQIDQLKGQWVYFIDDDDWVDNNIVDKLNEVIEKHDNINVIVWPHIRYTSLNNHITGNVKIDPNYEPTPRLQSNHCAIKLTETYLQKWKSDLSLQDKTQHWNLSQYVFDDPPKDMKILEIEEYLSLWNNTPLSFSWWMHPEVFSMETLSILREKIDNFCNYNPDKLKIIKQNYNNTSFPDYIQEQQHIFIQK